MNDISNVSDSVIDKIRKLLALNQSSNEHESALALQKAKQLAAAHEIDISLIEIFTGVKKNEPITKNNGIDLGQRKSITQRYVSWILQDHFGVKVIYSGNRARGLSMALIGTKDKISIAEYVQSFLNQEFMRLWHNYYKHSNCQLQERDSYLLGLYNGLCDKLKNEQRQVEVEKLSSQPIDVQNKWGLMVISEKEKLNEAVKLFYPRLTHTKSYTSKNYFSNVINDGFVAGKNISIKRSIPMGSVGGRITA